MAKKERFKTYDLGTLFGSATSEAVELGAFTDATLFLGAPPATLTSTSLAPKFEVEFSPDDGSNFYTMWTTYNFLNENATSRQQMMMAVNFLASSSTVARVAQALPISSHNVLGSQGSLHFGRVPLPGGLIRIKNVGLYPIAVKLQLARALF